MGQRSRIEPAFRPHVERFGKQALDSSEATICGLWPDLRIAYVNPRWARFAEENDAMAVAKAPALGSGYLEPLAPAVRPFYERLLVGALGGEARVDHDYECSSADVFRVYRMSVYPLPERAGLLVAHTPIVERPHEREPRPADDAVYRDAGGLITQCAHCRRTRRARGEEWDWVPDLLREPRLDVSHGLCPLCARYYYGGAAG